MFIPLTSNLNYHALGKAPSNLLKTKNPSLKNKIYSMCFASIGLFYSLLNKHSSSLHYYTTASALNTKNISYQLSIASANSKLGKISLANDLFKSIIKKHPSHQKTYDMLRKNAIRHNVQQEIANFLNQEISSPSLKEKLLIKKNIALLHLSSGNREAAKSYFTQYIELSLPRYTETSLKKLYTIEKKRSQKHLPPKTTEEIKAIKNALELYEFNSRVCSLEDLKRWRSPSFDRLTITYIFYNHFNFESFFPNNSHDDNSNATVDITPYLKKNFFSKLYDKLFPAKQKNNPSTAQLFLENIEEKKDLLKMSWDKQDAQLSPMLIGKSHLWQQLLNDNLLSIEKFKHFFSNLHCDEILNQNRVLKKYSGGLNGNDLPFFAHFARHIKEASQPLNYLEQAKQFAWNNYVKLTDLEICDRLHYRLIKTPKHQHRHKHLLEYTKKLNDQIEALEPEKAFLVLGERFQKRSHLGHAYACIIKKQTNGLFQFIIATTGEGLDKHAHVSGEMGNYIKDKVNPFYILRDIKPENILNTKFLYNLARMNNRNKFFSNDNAFYGFFKRYLKGVPVINAHPFKTTPVYITPQRSATCPLSILKALLRTWLNDKEYKKTIFIIKARSLLYMYEKLENILQSDKEAEEMFSYAVAKHKLRQKKIAALFENSEIQQFLTDDEWQKLNIIALH